MSTFRAIEASVAMALAFVFGGLGAFSYMNQAELNQELQDAAAKHDMVRMEWLLNREADPDADLATGNKPLIYAIQFRDPEAVRLLLEHGANPNARRRSDSLPAVKLARYLPEIRKILIQHGAIAHD